MTARIVDCEQGSEAWRMARAGIATASEFAKLLGIKKDAREKETRRKYLLMLAGEIITGEPAEGYENDYMRRGKAMEPEARAMYALETDTSPGLVGFIRDDEKRAGCSPDSLIGDAGLLEIKTKKADILIDVLLKGEFPPEHRAQCQGALWVSGREWIDLCCYWRGLPLFIRRQHRDEPYIRDLAAAVETFNADLDEIVERIRHYGEPPREAVKRDLERSLVLMGG